MSQPSQDNQGGHQGQYPGQAPGPPGTIVNLMSQQQFSQAQQHSPPSGAPTPVNPYYQQQFPLMIGNVQPPVPPQQTPPPGNNQWLPPSAQSSPSPSGRGPSRGRGAGRGRDTHAAFGGQQPLPQNTPLYPSPPTFLPQPPLSPSYHQHIQTFSSSSPPRSGYPQSIHPSVGYPVPVPQFPIPAPLYRAPSPAASTSDPAAPSFRNPGVDAQDPRINRPPSFSPPSHTAVPISPSKGILPTALAYTPRAAQSLPPGTRGDTSGRQADIPPPPAYLPPPPPPPPPSTPPPPPSTSPKRPSSQGLYPRPPQYFPRPTSSATQSPSPRGPPRSSGESSLQPVAQPIPSLVSQSYQPRAGSLSSTPNHPRSQQIPDTMPPRRSNKKSPRGKAEKTGQSSGQKQDESKPAAERLGSLGQFLEASVSSPKVTPNDQAGPGASLPGPATSTQDAAAIPVDESGRPVKLSKKQKQRQKKRLQQRMAAAEGQTSRIGESEIDAIVVDSDAGVEDSAMTGADEDGATAAETVEDSKKKGKQPMQAGRETKGPGEPKGPVSSVEVQYLQRKYEEEASTLSGGGPSPSTPLGAGLAGGPTHAPRENSPKAPESLELPMAPGGASTQLEAKSKGKGRKGRDLTAPRLASIKAASSTDAAHSAPSSGPESPLEGAGKSKGTSSAAARARSAARAMRESMKRQEEEEKKKKKESALSLRIDSLRAEGLTEPDEDEFFKTALRVEKMTKETAPAPFRADADPSLPTFGLVDWDGMFNELLGLTGPSSPPHQACVQSGLGNVADPATTSLDDLDAAFEEMEGGPAVCEPADAQDEAEAIMTSPLTSLSRVSTPVSLVEDSPSAPLSATPTIIAPETPPPAMSTHRRQMEQAFQQNMHRTRNVTRSERAAASEQNDADGLSVRSSLSTCSVMRKVSGSRAEGTGSGASTPQSARSTQSNASGSGRRSAAGSGANTSYTPRFHDIRESFGEGEGEGAGDDDVDLV